MDNRAQCLDTGGAQTYDCAQWKARRHGERSQSDRAWAATAADIGTTTSAALAHSTWREAAERANRATGRGASNGALMRVTPVGIAGSVVAGA